jgi:hypothetical protein
MRARLTHAKASFLLLLFMSAGTSLPSLDALAFHQDGAGERSRTHVEPAGGCLSHADHCTLGRTASGSGAVAEPGGETRFEPVCCPAKPQVLHLLPTCADHSALPRSRAPPTLPFV